jgi:phosphopantetheine--protein transferase-like protein
MGEIFGCGIDIEELARFDKYIQNNDYSLMRDICSNREFDNLWVEKGVRFALSFSCKEAFFKALGVGWPNSDISWKDIELLFRDRGFENYSVELNGYAKETLVKNNAKIEEASFDYNEECVRFQVILMKNPDNAR